ncbi:hypothetical protein RIF29_17967 [Crotalaria pallida]|uniref:Uncharacterized protein n=1 Tax=Crotalaria pallida TaxID=3830 RepID=A0AAN9IKL0_CROPI
MLSEEDKQSPNVVAHCGLTFSSFNVKNALAEMEIINNENDMVTLQIGPSERLRPPSPLQRKCETMKAEFAAHAHLNLQPQQLQT